MSESVSTIAEKRDFHQDTRYTVYMHGMQSERLIVDYPIFEVKIMFYKKQIISSYCNTHTHKLSNYNVPNALNITVPFSNAINTSS